jgi:hypothetical protein
LSVHQFIMQADCDNTSLKFEKRSLASSAMRAQVTVAGGSTTFLNNHYRYNHTYTTLRCNIEMMHVLQLVAQQCVSTEQQDLSSHLMNICTLLSLDSQARLSQQLTVSTGQHRLYLLPVLAVASAKHDQHQASD